MSLSVEPLWLDRGVIGPELSVDAALYLGPWDAASIKDVILRLKSSPALAGELVVKARARLVAATKPWDEIASDLLAEVERLGHETR